MIAKNPQLEVYWVVFGAAGERGDEARRSADAFLAGATTKRVRIGTFHESYFPSEWPAIKNWFEEIKSEFKPDIVFTHYRDDRHQDHRVLSDLAWNTFRDHLLLEYEIPKFDGDLGSPNLFVPLPEPCLTRKIDLLFEHFRTQSTRHWFTRDTFAALHRLRGIECVSPSGLAEAFYCRKLVVTVDTP
jgi:LmbE family N-acetylglucosaminyl deacetylase